MRLFFSIAPTPHSFRRLELAILRPRVVNRAND